MYIRRWAYCIPRLGAFVRTASNANCDNGGDFLEDYRECMASKEVASWSFWAFVNIVHCFVSSNLAAQYEEPQ